MSEKKIAPRAAGDFSSDLREKLLRGEVRLGEVVGLSREALYGIAQIAYQLLNSGKLHEAKRIYAGLAAADPYDSVFRCHLAAAHHRLGEMDEAVEHYTHALRLNIGNADALAGRGEIHLMRGQFADAVADLRGAVSYDREATRASTRRARALLSALEDATAANRHGAEM